LFIYFSFSVFVICFFGYILEAVPNMPVKKSDVVKAVVVRTSKGLKRESGMMLRFDENAAVLINADGSPRGTMSFS
jgi:large subunit ribosomal protein L14